jgi:hypothetical protein
MVIECSVLRNQISVVSAYGDLYTGRRRLLSDPLSLILAGLPGERSLLVGRL